MYSRYMKITKIISSLLALGALLILLSACHNIKKTQLVMFESISFNMPLESFEKVFGKPNEIVEETETGYHDTWHARDPYLYKTGRLSLPQFGGDGSFWGCLNSYLASCLLNQT